MCAQLHPYRLCDPADDLVRVHNKPLRIPLKSPFKRPTLYSLDIGQTLSRHTSTHSFGCASSVFSNSKIAVKL